MTEGKGFTLVEILVALAVLAIGLMAALTAVAQLTANEAYVRDRTLATWVAHNRLVEEQLSGDWPSVGERKGTAELAGQEWYWKVRVSQTEEAKMRRLDVEVRAQADDEATLALLSGFVEGP